MNRVTLHTSNYGASFDVHATIPTIGTRMILSAEDGTEAEMEDVVEIEQDGVVIYVPMDAIRHLTTTLDWNAWGAQTTAGQPSPKRRRARR